MRKVKTKTAYDTYQQYLKNKKEQKKLEHLKQKDANKLVQHQNRAIQLKTRKKWTVFGLGIAVFALMTYGVGQTVSYVLITNKNKKDQTDLDSNNKPDFPGYVNGFVGSPFIDITNVVGIKTNNASFTNLTPNSLNHYQDKHSFLTNFDTNTVAGYSDYLLLDIANYVLNRVRRIDNKYLVKDFWISDIQVNNQIIEQANREEILKVFDIKPKNEVNSTIELETNETNNNLPTINLHDSETTLETNAAANEGEEVANENSNVVVAKPTLKYNDKISFKFQVTFAYERSSEIELGSKKIGIESNKLYTIEVDVKDQLITPEINFFANKAYFGWKLENATYKVTKNFETLETWSEALNLTVNSYSHVFKLTVNNILEKGYLDLYEQYKSNNIEFLHSNKLKTQLEEKFKSEFSKKLEILGDLNEIVVDLFKDSNTAIIDVIKSHLDNIVRILINFNILPNNLFVKAFVDSFKLNTDEGINDLLTVPFIDLIKRNVPNVTEALNITKNNPLLVVAGPYLDFIKDLNQNSDVSDIVKKASELIGISGSAKTQFEDFLTTEVFGVGQYGNKKTLFNIILDNIGLIKVIIAKQLNNSTLDKQISTIVDLLLSNKKNLEQKISVYDLIFKDQKTKQDFINLITSFIGNDPVIKNIVEAITTDNVNFTFATVKRLLTNISRFLDAFLKRDNTQEELEKRFVNLNFDIKWNKEPKYDEIAKSLDFDYEISFTLKHPAVLSIFKDLKSMINIKTALKILDGFVNVSAIKGKEELIKITNVERTIKGLLPNEIVFGRNTNSHSSSYSFKYVSNNKQTWFKPISHGLSGDYYLGNSIGFDEVITVKDYAAAQSLLAQYDSKARQDFKLTAIIIVGAIGANLTQFYTNFIQNFLLSEIKIPHRIDIFDEEQLIAKKIQYEQNSYNSSLTKFEGLEFSKKEQEEVKALLNKYKDHTNDQDFYKDLKPVNEKDALFTYKDKKVSSAIYGKKALVSPELKEKLDSIFKKKFEGINFDQDYQIEFDYDVLYNFNTSLKVDVAIRKQWIFNLALKALAGKTFSANVDLSISKLLIKIVLPKPIYDSKNDKFVDHFEFSLDTSSSSAKVNT